LTYFDTNILIYATVEQDLKKFQISNDLIYEAIKSKNFFISPLVLSEYIFILSKLKIAEQCEEQIGFYSKFIDGFVDKGAVVSAYFKCSIKNKCKNINDYIHLEIANEYCKKFVTFDSDFKNLEQNYDLKIEILS